MFHIHKYLQLLLSNAQGCPLGALRATILALVSIAGGFYTIKAWRQMRSC